MLVTSWGQAMTDSIVSAWSKIINFLPNLLGAIIVLIFGLIVAWILKWVVVQFFTLIRVQTVSDQIKLTELLKKIKVNSNIAEVFGVLVYWIIVIIFLLPTLEILGLSQVSSVLNQILAYIPNTLVAAFMVLVGILLADFVANLVKAAAVSFGATTAGVLASVVRYAIIVFVILAALVQLNIASYFLTTLFTGFVGMFAIAGGIAFGLGGKDAAKELIDKIKDDFSAKK